MKYIMKYRNVNRIKKKTGFQVNLITELERKKLRVWLTELTVENKGEARVYDITIARTQLYERN